MIQKFITLCELIENPVPKTEDTVAIYTPQRSFYQRIQRLLFIPNHFQATNDLEFGQLPSKTFPSRANAQTQAIVNPNTNSTEHCGESILQSLTIMICSAGLLIVLIYFIRYP